MREMHRKTKVSIIVREKRKGHRQTRRAPFPIATICAGDALDTLVTGDALKPVDTGLAFCAIHAICTSNALIASNALDPEKL